MLPRAVDETGIGGGSSGIRARVAPSTVARGAGFREPFVRSHLFLPAAMAERAEVGEELNDGKSNGRMPASKLRERGFVQEQTELRDRLAGG